MPKKRACRWCRLGRFHSDPEKFFRESHLCFDCSSICELNVQQLVPTSERKSTIMWPRKAYKSNVYKVSSV